MTDLILGLCILHSLYCLAAFLDGFFSELTKEDNQ